jgi:hypothetical protein
MAQHLRDRGPVFASEECVSRHNAAETAVVFFFFLKKMSVVFF